MVVNDNACLLVNRSAHDSIASKLAPAKFLTERYWLQMLVFSWSRGIRDALFQATRVRAAAFAAINVAIGVEVNVRIGPLRGYVNAVSESAIVPPGNLHEKFLIWKQEAIITCTAPRLHPPFEYPVLYVPDVFKFLFSIFGVMDSHSRQPNIPLGNDQKNNWAP
jgi:hypothetical protein